MDKYEIKTNELDKFSINLEKNFVFFKLSKITDNLLSETLTKKDIVSFYKIKGDKNFGDYIFMSNKSFDFENELRNGVKKINFNDLKDFHKYNLFLRFITTIKESPFFLNQYKNCSFFISRKKDIISALEFSVTNENLLTLNLNTFEKKDIVLKSFEHNKKVFLRIQKMETFKLVGSKLILDSKGEWIQKRRNHYSKNQAVLMDYSKLNDHSKMNVLFKLNCFLEYHNFNKLNFIKNNYSIYSDNKHWLNIKHLYKMNILDFLINNKVEIINKTNDNKALLIFLDEFKNTIQELIKLKNKTNENQNINLDDYIQKSEFKIFIVNNKDQLKKTKREDIYDDLKKENPYSQMIYNDSIESKIQNLILNCLKELMIKNDIKNNFLNFFPQTNDFVYYNISKDLTDNEMDFINVMIVKNNKIKFKKIDEIELTEDINNNLKKQSYDFIEFTPTTKGILIVNNKLYLIEKTDKASIPNFNYFYTLKEKETIAMNTSIKIDMLNEISLELTKKTINLMNKQQKKHTKTTEKELNKLNLILFNINELKTIFKNKNFNYNDLINFLKEQNRPYLLDCKTIFKNKLNINSPSRGEKDLSEHSFKNFIYIWYNEKEYFTGDSGTAKVSYTNLNYIYNVKYSKIDNDYLNFVDNVFVKHLNIANLPFPDKYIREYLKIEKHVF